VEGGREGRRAHHAAVRGVVAGEAAVGNVHGQFPGRERELGYDVAGESGGREGGREGGRGRGEKRMREDASLSAYSTFK